MEKGRCIVEGPLPYTLVGEIMERDTSGDDRGGISVFAGQVRADQHDGRTVEAIEYSAYEEMVCTEVEAIRSVIMGAFSDVKSVTIVHSTGIVKAGEISLLIVVSAGHRDQATRACRHTLEMVKERLPVWKKELFSGDKHRWI